ncbi:hypothetical protein HNQ07_004169 [Deinococcus metalli]|uniref:DUF7669 domain-containing protein n=1 Tax=Deinococcus metalli TaxID=1141878 RepID=A0A7W8KID9_9DEIO|nr:hypothetical protein [Deinococcus metalli]MBB5378662.1 hypothetical protein [Deinococcus metalli]GHF61494.1 hypothetical protein GCM10017781_42080 [Deinococcus metalli]
MTCRDEILSVIRRLIQDRPDGEFGLSEVIQAMRTERSPYHKGTIMSYITSFMCANAPSARYRKYNDLERVGRGRYRLREPHWLPS